MKHFIKAMAVVSLCAGTTYAEEGVKLISHNDALAGNVTTGDAPGYPVTLSRRGSYQLSSNLRVSDPNVDGVHITIDNVSLNLNGFSVRGPSNGGSGTGVRVVAEQHYNVTLRDGTIQNFGDNGVLIGSSSAVRNMRIVRNGGFGILTYPLCTATQLTGSVLTSNFQGGAQLQCSGSIATDSAISGNRNIGLAVGLGSLVKGNTFYNNRGIGLIAGSGTAVIANVARENFDIGFQLATDVGYRENVLVANGPPQISGGVQIGTNLCENAICP